MSAYQIFSLISLFLVSVLTTTSSHAFEGGFPDSVTPNNQALPSALLDVGIEEHLDSIIPLDAEFQDEDGRLVRLSEYFSGKKPVLFNFAYYRCPMLCNLVLAGMVDGLKKLEGTPGKEFEVVTVSIDPREGPEQASAKKKTHIEALGRPEAALGWHFLTGKEAQIKKVTQALGFNYRYNIASDDYSHTAAIFTLSPQGKICRYLYGVQYPTQDLRLALLEASEGKSISLSDKLVMFCYQYDPNTKGYVLFGRTIMRVGIFSLLCLFALFLGWLWLKDFRKHKSPKIPS